MHKQPQIGELFWIYFSSVADDSGTTLLHVLLATRLMAKYTWSTLLDVKA